MVEEQWKRVRARVRGLRTATYQRIVAPVAGLHQAAYLLAGLTLASQLLALLRDRAFAATFGAGEALDLYYAAFRVPDLVFAVVSSLVSAYILIPRLTGATREDTQRLLSETTTFLVVGGGVICAVLAWYMPAFLTALYPDLMHGSGSESFVLLGRMLLIQPILLGLSGIFGSVTQVHRRFFLFALSPVLYNLGIIIGTVYLYPRWGLVGIGTGVLLGAIAYLMVNVPVLVEQGVFPRLQVPRLRTMLPIVRDSVPRSLALGVGSVTLLVLTALASRMGTGSVSVLTLASNLEAVPLALIGASYAVAAFPALSAASALEDRREFTRILSTSARHMVVWSLVALGQIVVLRAHLVRVILGAGAFGWAATRLTAALLAVLAVGLAAEALKLLFSRALYAARQSWWPLVYQVFAGGATVVLALYFISLPREVLLAPLSDVLRVSDLADSSVLLLALASVIGQLVVIVLSLIALRRVAPGLTRSLVRPCVDGVLAASVAAFAAYGVLSLLGGVVPLSTLLNVLAQGLAAGVAGLGAAGTVLYAMGNREFAVVLGEAQRLLRAPQQASQALSPSAEEPHQP